MWKFERKGWMVKRGRGWVRFVNGEMVKVSEYEAGKG